MTIMAYLGFLVKSMRWMSFVLTWLMRILLIWFLLISLYAIFWNRADLLIVYLPILFLTYVYDKWKAVWGDKK
jgi:hypothetical protein